MQRRTFLQHSAVLGAGLSLPASFRTAAASPFPQVRIPASQRRFHSPAVEASILRIRETVKDPEIAWLFNNCYPNTLDSTVFFRQTLGKPDTFVITGDIHAMWLRDSSAQVWPYLPLMSQDAGLQTLIAGVIRRQTWCVNIDPYANAFNEGPSGSQWDKDLTEMKPELHERKYELDSLCYPIRLAYHYWKHSSDTSPFDADWRRAMQAVLHTMRVQQRKDGQGPYRFERVTAWATDTVPGGGYGNPIRPVGLIVSVFRPSDDATIFPFLVPSNHFAVVSLRQLAEMSRSIHRDESFARDCEALATEVSRALASCCELPHEGFGRMIPYEVDGYGNALYMDDSNVPDLLALPYLGALEATDPLYRNTRRFLLSAENPYYFRGTAADGNGSPHTLQDNIWPMSIAMRAMTSLDPEEIRHCLHLLKTTHAGTGFMHESFNMNDPRKFTRPWFAWANTLFGELILKVEKEHPDLLHQEIF